MHGYTSQHIALILMAVWSLPLAPCAASEAPMPGAGEARDQESSGAALSTVASVEYNLQFTNPPIITPDMSRFESFAIVQSVYMLPRDRREDAIDRTCAMLNDGMGRHHCAQVIGAIGTVSPEERANALEQARSVITDDMDGEARAQVIEAISKVPEGEIEDTIDLAGRLISQTLKIDERLKILDAVAWVPSAERARRVERARGQFSANADTLTLEPVQGDPYVQRVRNLLKTPLNMPLLPVASPCR